MKQGRMYWKTGRSISMKVRCSFERRSTFFYVFNPSLPSGWMIPFLQKMRRTTLVSGLSGVYFAEPQTKPKMGLMEKLQLLERIHGYIARKGTGPPSTFARKMGISERSLYRILAELKGNGIDIQYDRDRKTYVYLSETTILIKYITGKWAVYYISIWEYLNATCYILILLMQSIGPT